MTLFDPEPPTGAPRTLSLVKLSAEVARAVAGVGRVSVEGEVVNPRPRPSGRTYFTLRDRAAQITVSFSGARARRCRARHGERVNVTGSVTYRTDSGQLWLEAEEVVPVGAGAIAAHVEEARRRLTADGLIGRPVRPLPLLPRLVGVVCGADAAVRADIESVAEERFGGYPIRFVEVGVSGPGAAESVMSGLRVLLADPEVDVVILARGGGDAAQLLPFSDEELCRAIAAAAVPVVTAIGHERDRPLCDEVADRRAATPSLAAAAVIPSRADLDDRIDRARAGAGSVLRGLWSRDAARLGAADPAGALESGARGARSALERAGSRLLLVHPGRRVAHSVDLLDRIDRHSGVSLSMRRAATRLSGRRATLDALDPRRVLERGYAVVRAADGSVVRDPASLGVGDALDVELARGRVSAAVTGGVPPR